MGSIRAIGLGKAYKRYSHKWGRAAEWFGRGPRHQPIWVLQDIDLEIAAGEAVGIIGINGAGKSTLLKLITGTSQPTAGRVDTSGRIAALLELGIGFHPEFTGRQNAVNAARLAGLDPQTIGACLPEIEAFADIGDYLDQPLRTYSSGMQVRLAFAVATAVRPDILVIDEALAVGDIFFQQKCFERIRNFREAGTTLLFVSHAMNTVYSLCDRAVLLDHGRILRDGSPREVIDLYNARAIASTEPGELQVAGAEPETQPPVAQPDDESAEPRGDGGAEIPAETPGSYTRGRLAIESVTILCDGAPVRTLIADTELHLRVRVRFDAPYQDPHIGFQLRDRRGEVLYRSHTHGLGLKVGAVAAGERIQATFRFRVSLIAADYSVTVGVADGGVPGGHVTTSLIRRQDAAQFSIIRNMDGDYWDGLLDLKPQCEIERLRA